MIASAGGSGALTPEEMVRRLWEKSQVEAVMLRFGRALDTGDWPAYRSCFADRFKVNFERLTGHPEVYVDADLWTRFAEIILSPVRRHHQYSNMAVSIEGERAEAIVYMVARHWKATDGGCPEYTQVGWYENTFERIRGEWKITRLLHTYQWVSGNGALFDFADPALVAVMAQVFAPENRVGG